MIISVVALEEIEKGRGTQFDSYIMEHLIKMITEKSCNLEK